MRRAGSPEARNLLWAGVLGGLLAYAPCAAAQEEGVPTARVSPPLVRAITDFDVYTGRFQGVRDVQIRARTPGRIDEIAFDEGALVNADDVLFVLDDRRAAAQVARLEARVAEATSTRDLAQLELDRATELAERQTGAQRNVDQRLAERDAAQAILEATEAELTSARIDLADTIVRAPFAGRIGAARVDEGALVDGGSGQATVLASLVSIDPIEITFDASERDYLAYIRLDLAGQAASSRRDPANIRIRLSDEAEWTHPGQIDFVDNRLDPNAGTIRIRAEVPNGDGLFAPGLFAQVRVPRFGPYDALLLPDTAILSDQAGRIVYALDADDTVTVRPVEVGQRVGDLRVIRSGIEQDDRVVVSGLMAVQPGITVAPLLVDLTDLASAEEAIR